MAGQSQLPTPYSQVLMTRLAHWVYWHSPLQVALALALALGILATITPGDTGILLTHPRLEQLMMDRLLDAIIASSLSLSVSQNLLFCSTSFQKWLCFNIKCWTRQSCDCIYFIFVFVSLSHRAMVLRPAFLSRTDVSLQPTLVLDTSQSFTTHLSTVKQNSVSKLTELGRG